MQIRTILFACTLILALSTANAGFAQRANPAAVLQKLDRNRDGSVSMDEVPESVRGIVQRFARERGLDPNKPISIESIRNGGKSKSRSTSSSNSSSVPGFGVDAPSPSVPGFGADGPQNSIPLEERFDDRLLRYVDGIMRRYDKNENGILDQEEWKDVQWQSDPHESDLNKDGRLSREEFCERIAKRWGKGRKQPSSSSSSGSGFSRSGSRSSSSSGGGVDPKVRSYAQSLMRQYDSNKNGVLEEDEVSKMRGSWREADINKDKKLTQDELIAKLAGYGKPSSSSSGSSSSGSSSSDSSSSKSSWGSRRSSSSYRSRYSSSNSSSRTSSSKPSGKTYRFLTPTERLPKGLPSWFTQNDKNGDGQIMMSEYTVLWSDSKVEEFKGYDLNKDGVITPNEYLAAVKR